jgi:hypothetical protein
MERMSPARPGSSRRQDSAGLLGEHKGGYANGLCQGSRSSGRRAGTFAELIRRRRGLERGAEALIRCGGPRRSDSRPALGAIAPGVRCSRSNQ